MWLKKSGHAAALGRGLAVRIEIISVFRKRQGSRQIKRVQDYAYPLAFKPSADADGMGKLFATWAEPDQMAFLFLKNVSNITCTSKSGFQCST
jgi:hypothetical protein